MGLCGGEGWRRGEGKGKKHLAEAGGHGGIWCGSGRNYGGTRAQWEQFRRMFGGRGRMFGVKLMNWKGKKGQMAGHECALGPLGFVI
jgi:hypothetical protein